MSSVVVRVAPLLCLFASIGCGHHARMISHDSNYAVVAIPRNDNSWPSFNRRNAEELMAKQFPAGYVVDREEEFVTGTTQVVHTNTNTTGDPLLAALRIAPIKQDTTESTAMQNHTEWRIYFRKTDAPVPLISSEQAKPPVEQMGGTLRP